jgi:Ca2+-binding EF-hand superfamily protein
MKKLLIAAAALLAGTAVLAQVAPVAPVAPPAPMAHPMSDKVMTRVEVVAMVRDHFSRLDADKDGSISATEIAEARGKWAEKHKEGRGRHAARMEQRDPDAAFDRLDANKDGSISRDEFAKGREERIERRVEIREKRKEAAKDGQPGEFRKHRMGGIGGARMIVMADTDKDGRITLVEAETMALQHFDQMDTNRDGQVTPEERRAGRPMMIKRMQAPGAG